MGFPRRNAAANVEFDFICSDDTAILTDVFDSSSALAVFAEDEAVRRFVEKTLKPDATAEQRAEGERLVREDVELTKAAFDAEKKRLILDEFFRLFPECKVPRDKFEAIGLADQVLEQCVRVARKLKHQEYRDTGEETVLGQIGPDAIRFRMHMLTPPLRAEAKGRLHEKPVDVPQYTHFYNVNRWIVGQVLVGAKGWPEFKTGPNDVQVRTDSKHVSTETLNSIPEDWIIELGDFILELPDLKQAEKKV